MTVSKEVTKPALPADERFVSRSGVLQPNMAEINRLAEARLPQHQKDERLIDRTGINELENAVRGFQDRITDRENSVATIAPAVAEAERRVAKLREDAVNCAARVELR